MDSHLLISQPTRRGLFGILAGGAVALAAVDPEKALWVPGRKCVFIPKRGEPKQFGIRFVEQSHFVPDYLSEQQFNEMYMRPAIATLMNAVDEYARDNRIRTVALPLPQGCMGASTKSFGKLHNVRHVKAYDVINDQIVNGLDVLCVPCGVAA